MKLGEKHRIFLITGNEELIKLGQDAKAQYEEYSAKVQEAMENPDGAPLVVQENNQLIPYGFKEPVKDKTAFRKGSYGWVPNKKTKSGARIHQALRVLGPFELRSYKWMVEKKLFIEGVVEESAVGYFLPTVLTSNLDKTEFLMFIPEIKDKEALIDAINAAREVPGREEISYGNYYDNYRDSHGYKVL